MTIYKGPGIQDVDAAVRSVLAERFDSRRGLRSAEASLFSSRLLSLREAESLPVGSRVVRVAPGTVVTPLARDYLKKLGVAIQFASRSEVDRARNAGEWGFAIESESGLLEAFRRSMLDSSEGWIELGASADLAVGWVAEMESRGALVLVDEASLAVYRAYQTQGLRAATVEEPNAAARAVRSIGANLLVVEPAGKSIALLRQIAATFRRAGGPRP
jgi:hypothetical protein